MRLDEVLSPGTTVREVEAALYSVLDPHDQGAPYDSRAKAYDKLVSSAWYSRIAWGVDPQRHTQFIARALTSQGEGWVVDVAAGSCVASAEAYAATSRPVIVLDRSIEMLRRGKARVHDLYGTIPSHLVFLQADAYALPLRTQSMATVLCHGAFHVFSSPEVACAEWARVLRPSGRLHVSSLVRGRWLGDRYLDFLHRAGEVSAPRSAARFARLVEDAFGASGEPEVVGNFAYLSVARGGAVRADEAAPLDPNGAGRPVT